MGPRSGRIRVLHATIFTNIWYEYLNCVSPACTISIQQYPCIHVPYIPGTRYAYVFLFFFSSSLLRRRCYPQRSSGQAVVTGVVPPPPGTCLYFLSRIESSIPTAHRFSSNECWYVLYWYHISCTYMDTCIIDPLVLSVSIYASSAQPSHHRIFWREETTSTSLWEGAHRAIEAIEAAEKPNATPTPKHEHDQKKEEEEQLRSTEDEENHEDNKNSNVTNVGKISGWAITVLQEVSTSSDLRRLARLLAERNLNFGGPEAFTVALHDGNPAIVEMILRQEREHSGVAFTRAFRAWANVSDGEPSSPGCLPLHLSCHAGSPEVLSVLLEFIVDSYPVEDRAAIVNARDLNGRSALHLASWSPRPQCPGKRNAMIRCGTTTTTAVYLSQPRPKLHFEPCVNIERARYTGASFSIVRGTYQTSTTVLYIHACS